MIVGIADTTIWYLFSDPRLGRAAATFFEEAQAKGDHIGVSAISLVRPRLPQSGSFLAPVFLTTFRIIEPCLMGTGAVTPMSNLVCRC
jgi:hypothetical protein